ncbi:MAG TPA: fused MFS/spermidine synthase [Blastocatellia bacterium]|nr:fused MFS/spermidine synthase [Blastocatellia bacterium]
MQSILNAKPAEQVGQSGQGQVGVAPMRSRDAEEDLAPTGARAWLLRAAVMIGGAAVMVVEILGSRVLAPKFGTTLHVWSALITVTLAALAVGYAVGGRVADRRPGLGALMTVMACAGGTLLISDLIARPVLGAAYDAGMVSGTFMAATLLFLPTLFLLGMLSPMAVRAAANYQHLGASVGNLYALSTVGSVAGSLLVSLLLIPNMTVHAAFISTAVALAVVPIFYLIIAARKRAALGLFVGLALSGAGAKWAGAVADREVLYKDEFYPVTARIPSAYGDLVVSDRDGVRYLFLNGVQQGSMIGDVSYAKYAYGLERLATVKGVPKTVLIWGLGPGVYARAMAEAGSDVTVIEIDPMSEKVAREYFGLPASVRVIIGDARTETSRLTEKYDVIVLDAFSGDSPPFHLLTREAFADLKKRLAPGGLVVANIVGGVSGEASRVASSIVATMENVFGKTQVFSPNWLLAGKKRKYVSTMFLLSGDVPENLAENAAPFTMKTSEEIERTGYIEAVFASRLELPRDRAVILTDDYAPLEAWSDAAVEAMRY